MSQRTARGEAWLDEVDPQWPLHVDLSSLDMSDARVCVAGQVGRVLAERLLGQTVTCDRMAGWVWLRQQYHLTDDRIQELGFIPGDGDWDSLLLEWADVITSRRLAMSV